MSRLCTEANIYKQLKVRTVHRGQRWRVNYGL